MSNNENDMLSVLHKIEKLESSLNIIKTLLSKLVKKILDNDDEICLTCGSSEVYYCDRCGKNKLFCLLCNKDEFRYGLYFNEPVCIVHKMELRELNPKY